MSLPDDIVTRLREGAVQHAKRWTGDTHSDLGGSIDEGATDALMTEAAAEITSLRSELARKEEALRTLSLIHDRNPSDAMADMAPVDYARHMLFEARQIALEALQPSSSEVQS